MSKIRRNKRESLIGLLTSIIVIIAVNIIGSYYFARFDLTAEGRYSLLDETKELIEDIDDVVYIKIYLEGDLPPDYKSLRNSTKELLDEFRAYNQAIEYKFINPSENEDRKERRKLYRQLAQKGLAYVNLPIENKDGYSQKTIFTSALITYKGNDAAVNLVKSNRPVPNTADINASKQMLELNLVSSMRKLVRDTLPHIAFTRGHGELGNYPTASIASELKNSYKVSKIELGNKINSLTRRIPVDSGKAAVTKNNFDLLVIAKPDSLFTDRHKFLLDQYVMNGGKIIWLLDMVDASMDSLQVNTSTLGIDKNLGLQTMLYKYGVRINKHLVLNRNALEIGTAEGKLRRWDYFPLALPASDNIICENVNAVKTQFVNSLDIVGNDNNKKTVLLKTDDKTRIMPTPAVIDVVDIIYRMPNKALYNKEAKNLAVLIEGKFESIYKNRPLAKEFSDNKVLGLKYESPENKMLVIADGDIIRNQVRSSRGNIIPLPLGFDRYTGKMFDNQKFILNSVNYMLEDKELIKLRNKEFKIRLLNKDKVKKEKLLWQLINSILPPLIIIMLGISLFVIRKRFNK